MTDSRRRDGIPSYGFTEIDGKRFIYIPETTRRILVGKPLLPNEDRKAIDPKGVE